jgi:hypothetical protein
MSSITMDFYPMTEEGKGRRIPIRSGALNASRPFDLLGAL